MVNTKVSFVRRVYRRVTSVLRNVSDSTYRQGPDPRPDRPCKNVTSQVDYDNHERALSARLPLPPSSIFMSKLLSSNIVDFEPTKGQLVWIKVRLAYGCFYACLLNGAVTLDLKGVNSTQIRQFCFVGLRVGEITCMNLRYKLFYPVELEPARRKFSG